MAEIARRRDKPESPLPAAFLATLEELRPARAQRRAGASIALSLALHIMMCDRDGNGEEPMATNLALDDKLIEEAVRVGGHRTKKAAVTAALTEYVKSRRRQRMLRWKGQVEYFDDYDYKALRRRRA